MAVRTILRLPAVKAATGFESTSQIYDLMARDEFPRAVKLSAQAVGWYADEIAEWQQARKRITGAVRPRKREQSAEAAA